MTDISTIMAKDPLSLTNDDLDAVIAYYREHRALYNAGAKPTKKPTEKQKETMKLADKLDLGGIKI